ncbi:MAG: presenilin family intramembrane aspartyl protease PSH [Haloarculaceae archaeon]
MDQRTRAYAASGAIVVIFLCVQLGALALVGPFESAGYQPVEDPDNPVNSIVYVAAILVMTGVMLVIIKFGLEWILRALMVFAGAYISLFVLRVVVPPVVVLPVGGFGINLLAWLAGAAVGVGLWVYPEWYVVDIAGVLMGAAAAGLFGISFGVLPALVLLVVLAVYDAISVYGTEHMLTLASGVMDLKVPIVLVVPLSLSYSYLDAELPDPVADDESGAVETADEATEDADASSTSGGEAAVNGGAADEVSGEDAAGETSEEGGSDGDSDLDREALFIGLGDAVIPTVLVASAGFFAPQSVPAVDLLGFPVALPALTAMAGTMVGLVILLRMVLKGRAHAGLPLLNGGTIAGYLAGALASGLSLVQALGLGPYV